MQEFKAVIGNLIDSSLTGLAAKWPRKAFPFDGGHRDVQSRLKEDEGASHEHFGQHHRLP